MIVPKAVFEQHIIVLGKTRSGKSSAMRYLVEGLLDEGKPVCIVDPKGDWWGLKASADGKRAGYPVVIFGGEHADVPLNVRSGAAVAELLATGNRSAIVDLGGWMPGDRTQFWIDFASSYFRNHRGRHYLVLDEVHNLCPKGKILDPSAGKMLHWSNRLASEGLGKGISMLAASQRPQKVHNDFLTSCETLIAMRVIHAADRGALSDWIDGCGDDKQGKDLIQTIASMERGEAWVWSPEAKFGPKRMQFPLFSTYDSFKPQAVHAAKLKGWAEVNLDEVKKKLEDAVREAEANDPAKLKAKIRQLEAALKAERAVNQANSHWHRELSSLQTSYARLQRGLAAMAKDAAQLAGMELPKIELLKPPKPIVASYPIAPMLPIRVSNVTVPDSNGEGKLRDGAERMLAALAQWHPNGMQLGQMRSHAGLKKSGTFSAYMSDLRRREFIREEHGLVFATQEGLEYCQHIPPAPSNTEEVLAVWRPKLREGARRMLDVLVGLGGEAISKEELGERADLKKSGTFSAYLSDLRTARLVTSDRGGMVAADKNTLFL